MQHKKWWVKKRIEKKYREQNKQSESTFIGVSEWKKKVNGKEAIYEELMVEIFRIEKMTGILRLSNTPNLKKHKYTFDVLKSQNIKN